MYCCLWEERKHWIVLYCKTSWSQYIYFLFVECIKLNLNWFHLTLFLYLYCCQRMQRPEAEFKDFEPRLKFKPRLKYGWFHLKLYTIFQDLSRRSIETGFWWFETRLKFIKFGHGKYYFFSLKYCLTSFYSRYLTIKFWGFRPIHCFGFIWQIYKKTYCKKLLIFQRILNFFLKCFSTFYMFINKNDKNLYGPKQE